MRLFFDMDDVLVSSSPLQQEALSKFTVFTTEDTQAVDDLISMAKAFKDDIVLTEEDKKTSTGLIGIDKLLKVCKLTQERVSKIIEDARKKGEPVDPNLIPLAKMGSNDILKDVKDLSKMTEKEKMELMYEAPLERIKRAWFFIGSRELSRIKTELKKPNPSSYVKNLAKSTDALDTAKIVASTFGEFHDAMLEANNKIEPGKNLINYRKIYDRCHLIDGALEAMLDCYDSGEFQSVEVLSHHNGGYEFQAKEEMIKSLIGDRDIKFNGIYFHGGEIHDLHKNDGRRRERYPKAKFILDTKGYPNINDCVLIDDSTANCDTWVKYGGIAILYKKETEEEQMLGHLKPHCRPDLYYDRVTKLSEPIIFKTIIKARDRRREERVKLQQVNDRTFDLEEKKEEEKGRAL